MKKIILILTLALTAIAVNAQSFLDNLRKPEAGKGNVAVVQSNAIDSLVNNTQPAGAASTTTTATASGGSNAAASASTTAPAASHNENNSPAASAASGSASDTEEAATVVDTRKKVMRNSYKMQGYRIQVFSGGNSRADRQKAETAGAVMKSNFPNEPIYVHFYSPSWKCRMGNYKTVEEARALLARVKKLGYSQACIVKGTISVQY